MTGRVVVETNQIFMALEQVRAFFGTGNERGKPISSLLVKLYEVYVLWMVLIPSGFLSSSAVHV